VLKNVSQIYHSQKKPLKVAIFLLLPLFLYNNCGEGFQMDSSLDPGSLSLYSYLSPQDSPDSWPSVNCSALRSKLQAPVLPLQGEQEGFIDEEHRISSKLEKQGNHRELNFSESLKQRTLTEEDTLLVTVDNQCFLERGHQSILTEFLESMTPDVKTTTYRFPIYEEISGLELYRNVLPDPCVLEVYLDERLQLYNSPPTDEMYSHQTYMTTINHSKAFASVYNTNNGINKQTRVAVIDSGVATEHPDLKNMMLRESGSSRVVGLDAVNPGRGDLKGVGTHGTHVAGLIAAQAGNGEGISGVAGLHVKLMPVRASEDGESLSSSSVINGLRWAVDRGAHVINLSLGGNHLSQAEPYLNALRYANSKGVVVVTAAGNEGREISDRDPVFPAILSRKTGGLIVVGAFDVVTGELSRFSGLRPSFVGSNYSSTYVDILAPGSNNRVISGTVDFIGLLSTVVRNQQQSDSFIYSELAGTSMAAPLVTGAVALVVGLAESRGFSISPQQVQYFLETGSDTKSGLSTRVRGGKTLNLEKLVNRVAEDTGLSLTSTENRSRAGGVVQIKSLSRSVGLPAGYPFELQVQKTESSSVLVQYQWFKNGHELKGEVGPNLRVFNASPDHKGIYQVRLKSGRTEILSQEVRVNIESCL
jgi:subtilisin family serine protease